jgi:hypothetical protein
MKSKEHERNQGRNHRIERKHRDFLLHAAWSAGIGNYIKSNHHFQNTSTDLDASINSSDRGYS